MYDICTKVSFSKWIVQAFKTEFTYLWGYSLSVKEKKCCFREEQELCFYIVFLGRKLLFTFLVCRLYVLSNFSVNSLYFYGIKNWGMERKRLNVYYWWLCTGGLIVGMIGYRMYCTFTAVAPLFFYWVFVIWGMITAGYGLMTKGSGGNRRIYGRLCLLSVLLIPLTLLYSWGIAFFIITVIWVRVWLPLWVWCLNVFIREYFQAVEKESAACLERLGGR